MDRKENLPYSQDLLPENRAEKNVIKNTERIYVM